MERSPAQTAIKLLRDFSGASANIVSIVCVVGGGEKFVQSPFKAFVDTTDLEAMPPRLDNRIIDVFSGLGMLEEPVVRSDKEYNFNEFGRAVANCILQ